MSNHEMTAELPLSGTGRRRDRRQSYKVDPAFQSRFRIRILGLALAISALGAAVMGGAAAVTLMPGFTEHRTLLQITILAFALGEGFLILYACDRLSHRYCGALTRIQRTIEEAGRGERPDPIRLRSTDEFLELAEVLNETLVSLGAMSQLQASSANREAGDPS
jgi:F0F1-type ATP synthase membrane subunit c/vacuolar-type H+-ATPase subunit K